MRSYASRWGAMALALLVCGTAVQAVGQPNRQAAGRQALPAPQPLPAGRGIDARRQTPVVEVYRRCKDSVVCLTGPAVKGKGPSIEEFFRLPEKKQIVISLGSGFVVHEAGYIITNAHTVEKVIAHQVTLGGGQKYWAELIALARDYDLALLKIDVGRPLTPVQLAKSGDLMIGEPVIVISNPHGLIRTCTAGVLSATDRASRIEGLPGVTLRGLIQSDAGMDPGSSGGPWFNVFGELIGVTTAGKSDSEKIGFAVPVADIRKALPKMLDVQHRYGLVTGLKVRPRRACKVAEVAADSPGAKAGILPGDLIVQLDGKPIPGAAEFHLALVGRKPNQKLALRLLRQDRAVHGSLTLGERPKPDGAALLKQKFGLTAVPLDKAKAQAIPLRVQRGVVITAVEPGLYDRLQKPPMPGDVLARIGSIRPRDLDHVGLLLDRLETDQPAEIVLLRLKGNIATRIDLTVTPRK